MEVSRSRVKSRTKRLKFTNTPPEVLRQATWNMRGSNRTHKHKGPTTRVIDPLGNRHPANKVPAWSFGGPCRIRTYDQRIKSPLLYQLS